MSDHIIRDALDVVHRLASFWNPGSTQFIVMTLPDVEITWLPEQVSVSLFRVMGRPQELAS